MNRRIFIVAAACAASLSFPPMASVAFAKDFSWDGTWAGKNAKGRTTEIKIAGGKVAYWRSNGQTQRLASSSVSKSSVSIVHAEGAKVSMTPKSADTVSYSWRGAGPNDRSTAILKRQ